MAGEITDPDELLLAFTALKAQFAAEHGESPAPADSEPSDKLPAAERAALAADPRVIALVHGRFRSDLIREHNVVSYLGVLPSHVDPAAWRTGFLAVHEGGAPANVRGMMQEIAPQALLRDLFRPEHNEGRVIERRDLGLDPGGRDAYALVIAAKQRQAPPTRESCVEVMQQARAEWRAFITMPWHPYLADDQPRREVFVATEPSINY